MRILFIIFILSCLFSVPPAFALNETASETIAGSEDAGYNPAPVSEEDLLDFDPPTTPQFDFEGELASIEQLEEAGKLLEAKKAYEDLSNQPSLTQIQRQQIEKNYGKLNIKILFSKLPTEGTEIYTVVSGDSLYKIAKKYDTTVELIKKSNQLTKDTIFPNMKLKVVTDSFRAHVDKSENVLEIYKGDELLKKYSVSTGKNNSTPVGEFKIVNKLVDPTWYKTGAIVPPESPENILGTRWMGFDLSGYGIHGTTMPETIGKQESSGCIRMHNADVEEIFAILPYGSKVTVTD